MAFYVYILRCSDDSYYTGHTENVESRVHKHDAGEMDDYTRRRRPVRLVFSQEFPTREEALAAERQIKGWRRGQEGGDSRRPLGPASGALASAALIPRPASPFDKLRTNGLKVRRLPFVVSLSNHDVPALLRPSTGSRPSTSSGRTDCAARSW